MMRRTGWILAWLCLVPFGLAAQEQAATVVEHRVQPGETLWSIASAYFDDPYAWRRILDANRDRIADPRFIEPGQTLRIPGRSEEGSPTTTTAEVQGVQVTTVPRRFGSAVRTTDQAPRSDRTVFYSGGGGQRPAVTRMPSSERSASSSPSLRDGAVLLTAVPPDVFYTAGWLVPVDSEPPSLGVISGFAARDGGRIFERKTAYPYDNLRLELGDAERPRVGDQLMTYRLGREIEYVGQVILPTGIVTVTGNEPGGVTAVLADEYGPVTLGDRVISLPPYPLTPGVTAEPAQSERVGRILAFQDSHLVQSLGSIAYIDLGMDTGVRVGDEFVVHVGERDDWDGDPIGRLQVVGVHEDHAAARIVHVSAPLFVEGLRVRLAARMP